MSVSELTSDVLDEQSRRFYVEALGKLDREGVEYLVGGAYAFARYTGIERHTKDFDIFIRRGDWPAAAEVFRRAGYDTELAFPHWLGKAFHGENFIDLIFSAGNAVAVVDDVWFEHAVPETVLGMSTRLIPPEEMIWSKGLIMERERFDGADVAHVLRAMAERLDWRRLIDRYAQHWRALFAHLVLFGYIYPSDRARIPQWVMDVLASKMAEESRETRPMERICYGTIISRQQYLKDISDWGYRDARLRPVGNMTSEEIAHWTAGIALDGAK